MHFHDWYIGLLFVLKVTGGCHSDPGSPGEESAVSVAFRNEKQIPRVARDDTKAPGSVFSELLERQWEPLGQTTEGRVRLGTDGSILEAAGRPKMGISD